MPSSEYVEEFDLACFPDERPRPGRRVHHGIRKEGIREYTIWVGGCGIGPSVPNITVAHRALREAAEQRLRREIIHAENKVRYYTKQLAQLNDLQT